MAAAGPPYVPQVMLEYLAFRPSGCHIAHQGEMRVVDEACPPVGVMAVPAWPDCPMENLVHSKSVQIVSTERVPGPQGYPLIQIAVRPSVKLPAGSVWSYFLEWDQRRVPFLHDERGGSERLLSLTVGAFKDGPRTRYCVAVPDNVKDLRCFDYEPFRRRSAKGWTLLDYDTTNQARATIHVGFTFTKEPAEKPPTSSAAFTFLMR
ncbi:MAG: hypothetical protein EB084_03740 [Proteobacteria bacterium]|nr:hypothetical protein [Pseudomonadota bacterium]